MNIDPITILTIVTIFIIALLLLTLGGYKAEQDIYIYQDSFILEAIDELTYEEGDTVTFCCENPDWDSCENDNVIICSGDWTSWTDIHYKGRTRIDCLQEALKDHRKRIQLKAN
jgi:hypothetical protein